MGATDRIVRHLNLRAESAAQVRGALPKLEDALRCASLPDTGTRVLLVRRLSLGRIAADATPQMLSRLLEQKFAAAGNTWTPATDPSAGQAAFVFFRDRFEARYALALQLAREMPCSAWYWPLAVAEFNPVEGPRANLRHIALAIAALPEARAALPAWIARLSADGVAPVIVAAIESADVPVLLRAAHLSVVAPRPAAAAASEPARLDSGVRDAHANQGPSHREPQPQAAVAPAAMPAWWQALASAGGFVADGATVGATLHSRAALPQKATFRPAHTADTDRAMPLAGAASTPVTSASSASAGPGLPLALSQFGGVLFLLPVLQRLGYAAWAETVTEDAAATTVRQMLAIALQRLQAPSDDPAWLLACPLVDARPDDITAMAPAIWRNGALAAPRGSAAYGLVDQAEQPLTSGVLARLWLTVCRRWLRRHARIGVASLVCRPAGLALSATHTEVYFRLNQTDMRVRRAALDLDPGWVWWYRRVVNFHYTESKTFATEHSGRLDDGR